MSEWWRGAVIYQIYPRSFQDSDGDGVGDLRGILDRLDHVADLGAEAVWLSPIFPSPMADMGYDVADYCGIDPMFGSLADFDALVARAHELDVKVIIDLVFNHSSDVHPWFAESRADKANPRADWYVWADPRPDGAPPSRWLSVFGGSSWTWEPRRRQYYLHNFLAAQPDLNVRDPEVQDALLDVMRFWLDRGVDGFRLDTVNYYIHDPDFTDNPPAPAPNDPEADGGWPPDNPYNMQDHLHDKNRPENLAFLERMRAVTDEYEDRILLGEIGDALHSERLMAEYTSGGRLHMAYSFDMLGPAYTPRHFRQRIEDIFEAAPDGWPCWAFSNHDVNRHVSRWAPKHGSADAIARQAIALLAGFQGTLCLYQGEELGQTETDLAYDELTDVVGLTFWPDNKGRDGCRTPMVWEAEAPNAGFSTGTPWLPVKPEQAARAVSAQGPGSVLDHYRAVLDHRRGSATLRQGATTFLDLPAPLLGFVRAAPGPEDAPLLCLYNLSPVAQSVTLSGPATLTGPGQAALIGTSLTLPPNGWAWLTGEPLPTPIL
ncbi:alpha-amylase family glycosyl hydrolase [Acidimangrovimonas sediminis]|uniref:alpha-amylase family glycosyl hydrolase n=1 Tax=Acidimangrovimonas sediminis TaxID=2056283 RepID=UPI000C80739F|nr:alpha-amylase family glycosyl hydrolase [Acidimangrovimonas sediminis]